MPEITWTSEDIGYWELARSRSGDWIVFDVRDDRIIRRFATQGAAQAWFDQASRGEVW